jgi:hypothetical protein
MSTLQSKPVHHRHATVVGAAWVAVGILAAFLVAFAILAGGHTTHTATTARSHPPVAAPATQHRVVTPRFIVDPGSGFAVPAHR